MYWNWKISGAALGVMFFLAAALVKPIGVSTQFVILDGIMAKMVHPDLVKSDENSKSGYGSPNAYLNKSGGKYAKHIANPFNYGFIFVLTMVLGGWVGILINKGKKENMIEQLSVTHKDRFGITPVLRYVLSFFGGFLILWGARLAGGCTSGHMMSGMMQTAMSGYVFAAAVFAAAVPTAMLLYKK
jgi:hypothetical protein